MRKGKGRKAATPPPARPVKHTLHFLLHGEGNETVQGTLVLDNFPLNGDMGVGGLSTPVQSGEQAYDEAGASAYAIVVIAVYGFSIVMLIASHIFLKKKADKRDGGDEKQIDKYLAQVPSLKEKSQRDSFRRLKKSIIPLLSMGMANDITAIAATPLGQTAFQRHMELLDQNVAGGRSPTRSLSMGHSPSGMESPPGEDSPATLSPSLDESSGDEYDDSVKVDMPLERDRSFDRVSQSRMPIIVEIDEATDSPTAAGRPLSSTNNADNDRESSESVLSPTCSVSIESPPPEGRLTVSPWEDPMEGASGTGPLTEVHRVRSPRRCHPSELTFDFPEKRNTQDESTVVSPDSSEDSRDILSEQARRGSGKRSLPQWTPVSSFDRHWKPEPRESQRFLDEDKHKERNKQRGIQITFV